MNPFFHLRYHLKKALYFHYENNELFDRRTQIKPSSVSRRVLHNRQVFWLKRQHYLLPSHISTVAFLEELFSYSGGTAGDFHPSSLFTGL